MCIKDFFHWCHTLKKLTLARRWRSLVVLIGDNEWSAQHVEASLRLSSKNLETGQVNDKQGLVYQNTENCPFTHALTQVNRSNYAQYLGTEQSLVIFKPDQNQSLATCDFDIDAFAALSGTLVSGGMLMLVLKPIWLENAHKSNAIDSFMFRFLQQLKHANSFIISQTAAQLPSLTLDKNCNVVSDQVRPLDFDEKITDLAFSCVTQEQALAVEAMLKVLSGHRNRPLVLTADRGRGKSSALALAACQMLLSAKQPLNIIVTAPSQQALKVFFYQVKQNLAGAKRFGSKIEHSNGNIVFQPIDALLKEQPVASIVMVDEAAAIPVYLLQQLLGHYHRIIFASTVHGYEGAGRGFSIKFQQVLQQAMPNWRKMHIKQAIRWADDDPLEQFVFSSCLLNATLPHYANSNLSTDTLSDLLAKHKLVVSHLSVGHLLQNEPLLQQVFAVLVTAHYQTSPSDLRLLLNNPAISLFVLSYQDNILGVVMLMREGQVDDTLVELVRDNQRRLRDQFLPQSLLMQCGIKESFKYSYQRIMRIAIHPQFQHQGLGRYFLSQLEQQVTDQGVDFIGASFAANENLVNFWQQSDFTLARIGFSKDKASGEHSCLVIKALTPDAQNLQASISKQFYQQFDYWLTDEFTLLPAKLVWQVLNGNFALKNTVLTPEVKAAVYDFISSQRLYSSCVYALHHWLLKHCNECFDPQVLPLIARVLQKQSVERVCQEYGFTGKKALNKHLIQYITRYFREI